MPRKGERWAMVRNKYTVDTVREIICIEEKGSWRKIEDRETWGIEN